jgi:glycosyltransferase involved in cell wall biosynthesis
MPHSSRTILIVDTELEGHHVLWLTMVVEALRELDCRIVMLVHPNQVEVARRMQELAPGLPSAITLIGSTLRKRAGLAQYWKQILAIFEAHRCTDLILNNFDTIASSQFRLACLGFRPPQPLKGRISVIYHRPRPLDAGQRGLGNAWKRLGWRSLGKGNWFRHIWLLDQYLVEELQQQGVHNCSFIPDPCRIAESSSQPPEIAALDASRTYLLQYGVGDERKGSALLLQALQQATDERLHLWIAGKQKTPEVRKLASELVAQGKATLIDRYILDSEERWLFEHCTWVMLPYLSHYGSSNLLSKAAHFEKPVIASDFHLIGKNVVNNRLGLVFKDRNADSLTEVLDQAPGRAADISREALRQFGDRSSLLNFRRAITQVWRESAA